MGRVASHRHRSYGVEVVVVSKCRPENRSGCKSSSRRVVLAFGYGVLQATVCRPSISLTMSLALRYMRLTLLHKHRVGIRAERFCASVNRSHCMLWTWWKDKKKLTAQIQERTGDLRISQELRVRYLTTWPFEPSYYRGRISSSYTESLEVGKLKQRQLYRHLRRVNIHSLRR